LVLDHKLRRRTVVDELIEAMARALCEQHIRVVRRWDTTPEKLEEMMSRAVDHAWPDHEPAARAALAAINARGDRVVPAEPTREMLVETAELENSTAIHNYGGTPTADDYWSVMLSASPYALEKETR
jgi:1,6-anhydro-N-acetylmuramate kinase